MDDQTEAKFTAELEAMIREATEKEEVVAKMTRDIQVLRSLSQQGSSSLVRRGKAPASDIGTQIKELEEKAARAREVAKALWMKVSDMQAQKRK